MRHGWTFVPAGLVLVMALLGAGGSEAPSPDWALLSDGHFGMTIMPIYLVVRPDVGRDLKLNDEQVRGAKELLQGLIERGLRLKGKSKEDANNERRMIDDAMAEWLRQSLSEAQQVRLTQINLQWEGASAFRRTSVADYLDLEQPQLTTMRSMLSHRDQLRKRGLLTPAEFDGYSRQVLALLKPFQKEQWDIILGEPCPFSIGHAAAAPRSPAGGQRLKAPPQPPTR